MTLWIKLMDDSLLFIYIYIYMVRADRHFWLLLHGGLRTNLDK
jgi:hypothetical protein